MEKDYKKTGWVNGSEPDMDAEHMNNIEDGIDGLYHPVFDDSGTVEGITSFPAFLSTVINKMNPIAFYKNFKAGMKYVLHTGSLINNGLCTETGKYAADATQLNPNIENTLAWQVAKVNSDLAVQAAWSLEEVNSLRSSFAVGTITPETAVSTGISNAVDHMMVLHIPWSGPYPAQLLITAAGRKEMYLRHCINGTWDMPQKVLTNADVTVKPIGATTAPPSYPFRCQIRRTGKLGICSYYGRWAPSAGDPVILHMDCSIATIIDFSAAGSDGKAYPGYAYENGDVHLIANTNNIDINVFFSFTFIVAE